MYSLPSEILYTRRHKSGKLCSFKNSRWYVYILGSFILWCQESNNKASDRRSHSLHFLSRKGVIKSLRVCPLCLSYTPLLHALFWHITHQKFFFLRPVTDLYIYTCQKRLRPNYNLLIIKTFIPPCFKRDNRFQNTKRNIKPWPEAKRRQLFST